MRAVALIILASCAHPPPPQPHAEHGFADPDVWAPRFEDPKRDAWQKPDAVIAALKLQPNDRVADIGAATGYFPVRLARALPAGKVYGVDIEPKMTQYLTDRAANEGLRNLIAVLGTPDDPKLPEKVELILLVDTFHHVEDRVRYFARLKEHLAVDGRLAIIDFTRTSPIGPPPEHRIPADQVVTELKQAGWDKTAELDLLPYQHFLIFVPVR